MNIKKKWFLYLLHIGGAIIFLVSSVLIYKIAYNRGVDDFSNTQVSKAIDIISSNNSSDKLIRISDKMFKMAVFLKESSNNTLLYDELLSYYKNLVDSGKFEQLVKDKY